MNDFFARFSKSIGEEMIEVPEDDPNWRRIFIDKVLNRWSEWILNSEIEMDLAAIRERAESKNFLLWPLARIVLKHGSNGSNARLVKEFTTKSFYDGEETLKILRFILATR